MNINTPLQGRGLAIPFTKAADPNASMTDEELRLPLLSKVPDSIRNHFIAMCGEFVGTVLFLWFALSGAQVANSIPTSSGLTIAEVGSNPQQLQYIALCFGFSLAVNAWVFFRISGGLFNPAVTLGMCLIGALPWVRGALLLFAQVLGGLAASALVSCMFPGELNVQTRLGGGTSVVQGLFIEMFLTAQLVFTIFMLAAEKHKGTFIAPVGIGLSLFVAELTGVYFTGGSLNPTRSFGPAVINLEFVSYHWIYWVGPVMGSVVAAGFYKFIKILEYETANPDQDMDHAAKIERKKNLLMEAGINEVDAAHVAAELQVGTEERRDVGNGGPDEKVFANGQGRSSSSSSQEADREGMYGTGFRPDTGSTDRTAVVRPERPAAAVATGSQLGKYSYLGQAGRHPLTHRTSSAGRTDSPAIASPNDAFVAPSVPDEALGEMVVTQEPRYRFARTESSGV